MLKGFALKRLNAKSREGNRKSIEARFYSFYSGFLLLKIKGPVYFRRQFYSFSIVLHYYCCGVMIIFNLENDSNGHAHWNCLLFLQHAVPVTEIKTPQVHL